MMRTQFRNTMAAMCAAAVLVVPAAADAQTASAVGLSERKSKIREWRWDEARTRSIGVRPAQQPGASIRPPRVRSRANRSGAYRDAQRVLAGIALGTVGCLAGSMVSLVTGTDYRVGAVAGGAAGGALGLMMVR
jgi:hypothetical protein